MVKQAGRGDARAFELLPAGVLDMAEKDLFALDAQDGPAPQLLAAAGQVAKSISDKPWLDSFIRLHAVNIMPGAAFFFGADLIDAQRLVSLTPAPMQQHRVFGVYDMDSFSRHVR